MSIGLNSPRTSAGASGLGSKVSMCDGPPASQMRMQFLAFAVGRPRPATGAGAEPEQVVEAQPAGGQQAGSQQRAAARAAARPSSEAGMGVLRGIEART